MLEWILKKDTPELPGFECTDEQKVEIVRSFFDSDDSILALAYEIGNLPAEECLGEICSQLELPTGNIPQVRGGEDQKIYGDTLSVRDPTKVVPYVEVRTSRKSTQKAPLVRAGGFGVEINFAYGIVHSNDESKKEVADRYGLRWSPSRDITKAFTLEEKEQMGRIKKFYQRKRNRVGLIAGKFKKLVLGEGISMAAAVVPPINAMSRVKEYTNVDFVGMSEYGKVLHDMSHHPFSYVVPLLGILGIAYFGKKIRDNVQGLLGNTRKYINEIARRRI